MWTQLIQQVSPRLANRLNRVSRRTWRLLLRIALIVLIAPVLLQLLLAYVVGNDARLLPPALREAKNLLIVTAHPDDECLFFAPSILGVLDKNPNIVGGLLVLSTGNNYGIGETRKVELKGSCASLGINPNRCVALDVKDLQDNPKVWWDEKVIEGLVKEYVEKWHADAILTFDSGGVSGHINHRAVSAAISTYASTDPHAPVTYMVASTWLIRKYTLLGDLPLTAFPFLGRILRALVSPTSRADIAYGSRALVVNTWHRYLKTREAFRNHNSQYSWDRDLYLIFSRYVWFNDLRRVERVSTSASASVGS